MLRLKLVTISLFLVMIGLTGCGEVQAPSPAIDLASVKCPALSRSAIATLRRRVPPPKAPVRRSGVAKWIDDLRVDAERKRNAGEGVIDAYGACRKSL